ncbi:recombinase family protein [Caulobacter endophyticus]|uniref:recombinase family protein n=1 Tax=Caulobacter endophyticus TaxID=2172652 RepID=UPI00240EAB7B|nr:recombinase family protein [Caulobacter endophyticus]MDG2529959.1 recombinase family protein [Caulobacter endophyticus]
MIGYFRVPPVRGATFDGPLAEKLTAAGCEALHHDACYALAVHKPGLEAAIASAKPGDLLVVPSLHAFAAHIVDLLQVMGKLQAAGIYLMSLSEGVDTRMPGGFFPVCAQLLQFNDQTRMVRTAEEKIVRLGRPRPKPAEAVIDEPASETVAEPPPEA